MKLNRAQALTIWGNATLQAQILSFNRFQKIRVISETLNADQSSAELLLDSSTINLPCVYDFSDLLCRLLLLPDSVLTRLCLFIGASHFAREIAASVLSPAGRELRSKTGNDVVSYCTNEGKMLICNKRSGSDTARAEELTVDTLIAAGACYLSDLNIASSYGSSEASKVLNESWKSRFYNIRTKSALCDNADTVGSMTVEFKRTDARLAVSDESLSEVFNKVAIADAIIAGMISKVLQKYEEETWKVFFM